MLLLLIPPIMDSPARLHPPQDPMVSTSDQEPHLDLMRTGSPPISPFPLLLGPTLLPGTRAKDTTLQEPDIHRLLAMPNL